MGPNLAAACPGCLAQDNAKLSDTYFWSTISLSLLPFGIVGMILAVVFYFRRLARLQAEPAPLPVNPETLPHSA